jgi:LemA protein
MLLLFHNNYKGVEYFMLWILLIIVVLIVLFIISVYNNLVTLKQRAKNSFSQMDVQLQRRFDLIPNLVETVKGYMAHESDTLAKVTELRTSWANAKTVDEKAKVDNELSSTLKTIMAVAEAYPDLKANQNFSNLQAELSETEDKISYSRQFYNDSVTRYNTKLELFPSNIIASMFHFTPENLFEVDNSEARKNVKVDFNK